MKERNPKVDAFVGRAKRWAEIMEKLRQLNLDADLTEEIKWGKPCYTHEGSNIGIIQPFKDACGYMFFKGALLKDPERILEKPGRSSQAGRRMMFTKPEEVDGSAALLRGFITEAMGIEDAGLEVEFAPQPEPVPEELKRKFEELPALKTAFDDLTPGRQRGYILHFSSAKQSSTRTARIERVMDRIMEGLGLND